MLELESGESSLERYIIEYYTVFTATLDFIMLVNQSKQVYLLLVRDELVFMVLLANAFQRKMN